MNQNIPLLELTMPPEKGKTSVYKNVTTQTHVKVTI